MVLLLVRHVRSMVYLLLLDTHTYHRHADTRCADREPDACTPY